MVSLEDSFFLLLLILWYYIKGLALSGMHIFQMFFCGFDLSQIMFDQISDILCIPSIFSKMNSIPNSLILLFLPFKFKIWTCTSFCYHWCSTFNSSIFCWCPRKDILLSLFSFISTNQSVMGESHVNILYSPLPNQACLFCNNKTLSYSWNVFQTSERYSFAY